MEQLGVNYSVDMYDYNVSYVNRRGSRGCSLLKRQQLNKNFDRVTTISKRNKCQVFC